MCVLVYLCICVCACVCVRAQVHKCYVLVSASVHAYYIRYFYATFPATCGIYNLVYFHTLSCFITMHSFTECLVQNLNFLPDSGTSRSFLSCFQS